MIKHFTPSEESPIDVCKLYDSERCRLIGIIKSGKKETPGVLHFKGMPSALGEGTEVRAIEDGIVTYIGYDRNITSRQHRRGRAVSVRGRRGVTISYERLSTTANIVEGEYIKAGEVIGYEGDSGSGKGTYLALRFSRCERLVNGCSYLGIPEELAEFRNVSLVAEDVVCKICGFNSQERYSIRNLPCADSIWKKILDALSVRRPV